jgi:hypothetical protein
VVVSTFSGNCPKSDLPGFILSEYSLLIGHLAGFFRWFYFIRRFSFLLVRTRISGHTVIYFAIFSHPGISFFLLFFLLSIAFSLWILTLKTFLFHITSS